MFIVKPLSFSWNYTENAPSESYSTSLSTNKGWWSVLTSYVAGDIVKVTWEKIRKNGSENDFVAWFEARASGVGENPLDYPLKWKLLTSDNKTALVDKYLTNQTIHTQTIKMNITLGIDSDIVIFLNCDASSINIGSQTQDFSSSFDGYTYQANTYFEVTPNQTLSIEIAKNNGDLKPKVGKIIVGKKKFIGNVDMKAFSVGMVDYSVVTTDESGYDYFEKKGFVKTNSYLVWVESQNSNNLYRYLSGIRTTPVVFIGTGKNEIGLNYGVYKDFDLNPDSDTTWKLNIDVRGVL